MSEKFFKTACLAICYAMLSVSSAFASHQQPSSSETDQAAIRTLISQWVEAYKHLDAKRLAALEIPDVQTVDRFGALHAPSGRNENETLWADAFNMVSSTSAAPTVTLERIQFLRPDVALVQMRWRFSEGILFVDGERMPPFSQVDTYVVIKSEGVWLVAAHNMQEEKP